MCGIAGIYSYSNIKTKVQQQELLAMSDAMLKRGPDGSGSFISNDEIIGLAHRRLAIIDLSDAGKQPMFSADNRYVIVFNGEIYNYQILRDQLEKEGASFVSHSDTEVLLKLFQQKKEKMLPLLRGMFALTIWDEVEKTLFVARDHLGIKPLYYSFQDGVFRFASQVKAILAGNTIKTTHCPAGQVGLFLWGHIPEPFTLYNEIQSMPAGSYMFIKQGQQPQQPQLFWQLKDVWCNALNKPLLLNAQEQKDYLREALTDTVKHHLIADVPVGVFLSAGLDSTTLAALTAEFDENVRTVTLGFKEFENTVDDETILANQFAQKYGTKHTTSWLSSNDFHEDLENIIQSMDQPTIDGVNTYFVCKITAATGLKVALSGAGGDELFGSYDSFKRIPKFLKMQPFFKGLPFLNAAYKNLAFPLVKSKLPSKAKYMFNYIGNVSAAYFLQRSLSLFEQNPTTSNPFFKEGLEKLNTLNTVEKSIEGFPKNLHAQISGLEMQWYMRNQLLRDADWASMAHSLELRTPFVDVELINRIAPLVLQYPTPKKQIGYAPRIPLPTNILEKPKTGFSVPVTSWLLKEYPTYNARGYTGWAAFVKDKFIEN